MMDTQLYTAEIKRYGIGLTGGIGTGKSTVGRLLKARGYGVIDADQLARGVTAPGTPGLQQVIARFGQEMLAADGSLDRKRLGQLIFSQTSLRVELEAITHPLIRHALQQQVAALQLAERPSYFFYEAALIFETRSASHYAQVWATFCSPQLQRKRVMERDGISAEAAERILASQMSARDKAERADHIVGTDGSLASVEAQVDALLDGLTLA